MSGDKPVAHWLTPVVLRLRAGDVGTLRMVESFGLTMALSSGCRGCGEDMAKVATRGKDEVRMTCHYTGVWTQPLKRGLSFQVTVLTALF